MTIPHVNEDTEQLVKIQNGTVNSRTQFDN